MFGDKLIVLVGMFLIFYFGYKKITAHYAKFEEPEENFDSVDEIAARKAKKAKMLAEFKQRYAHLSDEITITDDLIVMKNNVELSEDELEALDKALAEEKAKVEEPAEEPAEASDKEEEKK